MPHLARATMLTVDAGTLLMAAVALVLALAGAVLALLSLCWRFSRSPAARWWERREPIRADSGFAWKESLALVISPAAALVLIGLAVLVPMAPLLAGPTLAGLWAMVAALLVVCVLAGIVHWSTWQRRVLPLWVYPSDVRARRRADAARLRSMGVRP